jgi:hypothetical protein
MADNPFPAVGVGKRKGQILITPRIPVGKELQRSIRSVSDDEREVVGRLPDVNFPVRITSIACRAISRHRDGNLYVLSVGIETKWIGHLKHL